MNLRISVWGLGLGFAGLLSSRTFGFRCMNLIKKPWVLIRALNMDPRVIGPGFLNQVPTLVFRVRFSV